MAALGGIDIVLFALGIFFILKVIRQLVRVVWHSVDKPITRTLTCLIDVYFFFNGGGITKFESHSFPTFLYIVSIKMILHITFLSLTFSLLCFFVIIIIFTI